MKYHYAEGSTPIDPDEAAGLIPALSTQQELNEFELLNILEAVDWANKSRILNQSLLSPDALKLLHKRMFDRTWRWAGRFRMTQKSIGVDAYRVAGELQNLCEDTMVRIQTGSFPPEVVAALFHHRLVWIHPFPNGNGRHARAATDLLAKQRGWKVSNWGATNLINDSDTRRKYIETLRRADRGDISPLVEFMR